MALKREPAPALTAVQEARIRHLAACISHLAQSLQLSPRFDSQSVANIQEWAAEIAGLLSGKEKTTRLGDRVAKFGWGTR